MIRHWYDFSNNYLAAFDEVTGEYTRSNVYTEDGVDTGVEPFMGEFPHLLDIGIKGHCEHGLSGKCLESGTFCYQKGMELSHPDMEFKDYRTIIEQCKGKVFQVALGGRGDADCHKDYEQLLYLTREKGIVPNITTSGFLFNREKARIAKDYCGAAAVSWYKAEYTYSAIDMLLSQGVTTNIHFILSEQSIKEAVEAFEKGMFPHGIRAVIFLLYKPIGYDRKDLILKKNNPYLTRFFDLMNTNNQPYMIGFDSCLASGVLTNCANVAPECIEPCESARYSAYISSDMTMYPCSFIQKDEYAVDLRTHSIKEAWNSHGFERFRNTFRDACPECNSREMCLGGCPEINSINLCRKKYIELE